MDPQIPHSIDLLYQNSVIATPPTKSVVLWPNSIIYLQAQFYHFICVFIFLVLDPYIKLNLIYRGQRIVKLKTSRTKDRRTVNPVINEKCDILLSTMNMADIQVDIVMMSYDRFSHNHVIGSVSIGEMVSHESGQMHWNEVMRLKDTACSHWHALISTATTHPVQKAKSSIYQLSVMQLSLI